MGKLADYYEKLNERVKDLQGDLDGFKDDLAKREERNKKIGITDDQHVGRLKGVIDNIGGHLRQIKDAIAGIEKGWLGE